MQEVTLRIKDTVEYESVNITTTYNSTLATMGLEPVVVIEMIFRLNSIMRGAEKHLNLSPFHTMTVEFSSQ